MLFSPLSFLFAPLRTSHLSQSWWTETERAHILLSLSHTLWVSFNLCVSPAARLTSALCAACGLCVHVFASFEFCQAFIFIFFWHTTRTVPQVWLMYVFMQVKVVEAASALMCINACVN